MSSTKERLTSMLTFAIDSITSSTSRSSTHHSRTTQHLGRLLDAPLRPANSLECSFTRPCKETDRTFHDSIDSAPDYSLTIKFDHWTDPTKRSLLGVACTFLDGSKHLLELLDFSNRGHSSDVIVSDLASILSGI